MREHDSAFWETVEAGFARAINLDTAGRARFLEGFCQGRPRLRSEIESLLSAHDGCDRFLEVPDVRTDEGEAAQDWSGRTIGPFRLTERVGEGGMGVVYRAERADGEFTQCVAIKLLDASLRADALRRFRAERQILATLHHPHIVTLLDGGVTADRRAYLVMEYVDGIPISTYCADKKLGLEGRLALFQDVCSAVQHAHQHGVVHRDLKPANILVTAGTVKVLDFGIAKLLDPDATSHEITADPVRALTPNYASPEQLRGLPVTTASDIYGLGVLLYELVAGCRPYETARQPLDRVLSLVLEHDPARPSAAVDPGVPYGPKPIRGDLDAIILKAMSKDPAQRYASAQELSADLARFLSRRPVLAREPSAWYSARQFARRHRAAVAAAAVSVVVLVSALFVSLYQTSVAVRERDRATARFNDARQIAQALIFSIHDQVQPLPGSTPVRRAIVTEALKYLERLSQDPAGDDGLRLELARAYHRVGAVQGKPSEPNLGDAKGALASLDKAIQLLRPMRDTRPPNEAAEIELAKVELSLAMVATHLGMPDRAQAASRDATGIAEDLVKREPQSPVNRRLLGSALFQAALMAKDPESLPLWRRAGEVFEQLLAEQPDDPDRLRNVALVAKYIGTSHQRSEQSADALRAFERALALDERRLRRNPSDRTAQLDVAIDVANLAFSNQRSGRLAEAVAGYQRALEIRTRLAESDPGDVRARRFQGFAHTRLSELYNLMREYPRALQHAARAVGIAETLGQESAYRLDLMEALGELGLAQVRTGQRVVGCRAYERAVSVAAALDSGANRMGPDNRQRYRLLRGVLDERRTGCQPAARTNPQAIASR